MLRTTGARYLPGNRCLFTVWAPQKQTMLLHIVHPFDKKFEMQKDNDGYFSIELEDINPGARYFYMPGGGKDFPDPASHYQPEDVHGPSEVIDHESFQWQDGYWHSVPLHDMIIYECHIGTFTPEGTFEAAISRLDDLLAMGINTLEILPVSQFPGNRNWGYDGVLPYAVQNSYGGPTGLKKLVEACHKKGMAILIDVVYNHMGPEGNYFSQFAPYFTKIYHTPWGDAINYDGEYSDGVRAYFVNNIIYWLKEFHFDGIRFDAIHAIYDFGAVNIWELAWEQVRQLEQEMGRQFYLIAESDLNNPKVVISPDAGGWGFHAQWLDDFHHALYVILHEEGKPLYYDFGAMEQLAKAYTDGFVHSGEYVKFRKKKFGASSAGLSGDRFVAFIQNHDQIGNRVCGDRLTRMVNFERLKMAAAAVLLSPYIPMLYMGEEYAEDNPFCYFVSHSDKDLVQAVREGRKREFAHLGWNAEPPDPQGEETFNRSKLSWEKRTQGKHAVMLEWYKELISMRRSLPALRNFKKEFVRAFCIGQAGLVLHRNDDKGQQGIICVFNFSDEEIQFLVPSGKWKKILDSKEKQWLEKEEKINLLPDEISEDNALQLPPTSITVYQKTTE